MLSNKHIITFERIGGFGLVLGLTFGFITRKFVRWSVGTLLL
jgi:hypothetical protein